MNSMAEQERKALDRWCRFLGFGYPRANLWIVGIEEGGGPHDDVLRILTQDHERIPGIDLDVTYEPWPVPDLSKSVWRLSAKLAAAILGKDESGIRLGTKDSLVHAFSSRRRTSTDPIAALTFRHANAEGPTSRPGFAAASPRTPLL